MLPLDNKTWQCYTEIAKKTWQKEALFMEKEEILRKSREDYSEKDEAIKDHLKQTRPILIALLAAALFLFWLDGKYLDGRMLSDAVMLLAFAAICAEDFYIFTVTRKKIYLFTSVLLAVDVLMKGYMLIETAKDLI